MNISRWLRVGLFLSISFPVSAQPASQPATQPNFNPPPQYPVPYAVPKVEAIKQTLDRIRTRLENGVAIRVVDNRSFEPITDFSKPLTNAMMDRGDGKKFNLISYPMGVINSGMLLAAEATGDMRYSEFVTRQYQYFSDHYAEFEKWGVSEPNMRKNPFWNFYAPDSLDACGAMGAAMVKARRANLGPDMKTIIDRWADHVHKKEFRVEDGTLARNRPYPNAIWGDDMYMSVPLLAQYGALTKNSEYFDDAVKQVLLMSKHLFVPETGLYAHATHLGNEANHPRYYWGRANGWCMVATVELLSELPEDHPGRSDLIKQLKLHARGVAERQSGSGLWHQLLDRDDSYLETSCTAMFSYAMARAVNRGWLDGTSYAPVAVAGWNGVTTKITDEGKLRDVCIGTSYADDAIYYYHRPATDDIHGYGPVLLCGAEMIKLLETDQYKISTTGSGPVYFQKK